MRRDYFFINDLYDEHGNLYNIDYFQNTLGIQTNFVEIQGLLQSVRLARNSLALVNTNEKLQYPILPSPISMLLRDKKGCQRIYFILTNNKTIPVAQQKWQIELTPSENLNWKLIYSSVFKCTKDTKIRWFQYRLSHRILATNVFLHKIGIKYNNKCTFCDTDFETLTQLFFECPLIKKTFGKKLLIGSRVSVYILGLWNLVRQMSFVVFRETKDQINL